jgi:hypothetical protein
MKARASEVMMTTSLLLSVTGVYLVGLAVLVYLTRATRRRFLGALAGGLAVAVVGVGVEVLFQTLGFWHYPSVEQRYGPPLMYPLILLMWAGYSLIGWRVMRRCGWRGEVVFLAAVTILGTLRDFVVAALMPDVIAISPGIATALLDILLWSGLTALAQGVMQLIAGSAAADRLAYRPWLPNRVISSQPDSGVPTRKR